MKKKVITVSLIVFVIFTIPFAYLVYTTNGLILKGQFLYPIKCKVYADGKLLKEGRAFKMEKLVSKPIKVDRLVLWLPNDEEPYFRDVLILDKNYKKVGQPNSSDIHYQLFFNLLIQSDSGEWYVPFSDNVKGSGFEPELKISNREISFKCPLRSVSFKKIKVVLL